jgi:hypothetical protein
MQSSYDPRRDRDSQTFQRTNNALFDTDGTYFSFDGKKWYRWFPASTQNQQHLNKEMI